MFFKEKNRLVDLPVSEILPNPSQPRRVFSQDELVGLATSIKENGLLQPISVRRDCGRYYLIAGERRLRASSIAGIKTIPAIITNFSQEESAVLALLENIQREDLNIFEQATALLSLLKEWNLTQQSAAQRLGMSQSQLANKIRLLKLTEAEQKVIVNNKLTERHARALLKIDDLEKRDKILETVVKLKLNVSKTEELIESALKIEDKPKPKRTRKFIAKDIRIFINTIDHAVDVMKTAGIKAKAEKNETEDYIECVIRIPKSDKNMAKKKSLANIK